MKKYILIFVIMAMISSCVNSGHKSQSWHPVAPKQQKSYKR